MLAGCLKNNAAAQEALYNRFSPRMLGVCYRFAKNREDAEDMLQEGFIKVFTQMHQYRNEGALEGWIRRIMVHTSINILKKNKKFAESGEKERSLLSDISNNEKKANQKYLWFYIIGSLLIAFDYLGNKIWALKQEKS